MNARHEISTKVIDRHGRPCCAIIAERDTSKHAQLVQEAADEARTVTEQTTGMPEAVVKSILKDTEVSLA